VLLQKIERTHWPKLGKGLEKRVIADIDKLLSIATASIARERLLDPSLFERIRWKVEDYMRVYPNTAQRWRKIGFSDTPADSSLPVAASSSTLEWNPCTSPDYDEGAAPADSPYDRYQPPDVVVFLSEQDQMEASRIELIYLAAETVINLLECNGFACAIYGSLARYLYGSSRPPSVKIQLLILVLNTDTI
jgi:hypothetical protein